MTGVPIHGTAEERFAPLRQEFQRRLDSGDELGASFAVFDHGVPVVDLWGGFVDVQRSSEWQRDTITNVWSITKTMTALSALMLIDRGLLDPDAPVARYWPEFAANGKEAVTVKQLMSHTSGVSGWAQPFTVADIYDNEKAVAHLAAQPPWWEPGTASGYHILNYGHLIGELVRRLSGKRLKEFFRTEIAEPLGADFSIGVPTSAYDRISPVVPPPSPPVDLSPFPPESPIVRTLDRLPLDATLTYTDGWREAEIGAANGHGNARSVALVQSVITNGGETNGVRLLSPKTIERIFEEQAFGTDLVLFEQLRWGIGYALPNPAKIYLPEGRIAYWGGWGGSVILNDVDRGLTFSYVMNKMAAAVESSPRGDAYVKAFYESVGYPGPAAP